MNISKLIISCMVILGFMACTDTNSWGDDTRVPSLKASFIYFPQSQIELGGTSNLSRDVQLQSVETPWKITNPASDWLEVSPMEGSGDATVTFKAKANPTSDKIRTAVLSLESTDADYSFSRVLTVNQGKANSVLNPSEQSFELTREAQTKTVSITANTEWKASCSVDWIHLTKVSDTSLEIKIDENNESSERTAYISISGSKTSEIKITQSGVSVTPGQTYVEFSRESQTKTIDISSNYNWKASCSANWVSLKSSPETGKLSITVTENNGTTDRTAYIKLSGNNTTEIKVTQKGIYVTINQTNFELSRESQNLNINVSSNYSWQASCSANWIHLKSSPETGKLSITVDENNGTTDRTGEISISKCNSSISVLQHGYKFEELVSELDFETKSSTKTLNIQTDGAWSATSIDSWIHISPISGNGSAQLTISVDGNEGAEIRKGIVSVTVGTVTKYVSVQQKGAYFDVIIISGSEKIPAVGGTRAISFSTSEDWTVDCKNPSWVTVDKANGTAGVNTITLTFSKNIQEATRTDTTYIRIKNSNLQDIRMIAVQESLYPNGHEFVDLGLPSGTLWATCNVGANSPEESGDYFAWGETIGYNSGKTDFDWSTYKWMNQGQSSKNMINKYTYPDDRTAACWYSGYTFVGDGKTTLEASDDAAAINWGGDWRMPNIGQLSELINQSYTTIERTEKNGVNGYNITSKSNGNSIFLPIIVCYYKTRKYNDWYSSGYWSRNLDTSESYSAYFLSIHNINSIIESGNRTTSSGSRCSGKSIRPVLSK